MQLDRNSKTGSRKIAVIMFTDIVGYTALAQSDEAQALEVLERHDKLLRPFFLKFNGREVKTIGDSFLVEFESALDATLCAIEIQKFLHDYNIASLENLNIKLRIGLHVGDVVHSEGDILGDSVNIASRIQPLAEPGGICISQQVFDQIHNKVGYSLEQLEHPELKNVKFRTNVYAVVLPWQESRVSDLFEEHRTGELDRLRVAVLPFENISPDPNDEYFADGLTVELINKVSMLRGLQVIARTSVMSFKKKGKKISEIGKELRVGTLLEGSVRKSGNRIRISAELIDANSEGHLWAENYDRDLEDIFQVQTSIAEKVAGILKIKLLDEDRGRVETTRNIESYTLFLRAMELLNEGTQTSYREAIALFEEAIDKDPMFARAYANLAMAWIEGPGEDFAIRVSRGEPAARKALELAPESAESHAAMASVHGAVDRFYEERLELEEAIRINPNLVDANRLLGFLHASFGRFDEAIRYIQRACSLDPLDPAPMIVLIMVLRVSGRVDNALEVVERLKRTHMRISLVYSLEAFCYFQTQDLPKALEAIEIGLRIDPDDHWIKVTRGMAYALTERREESASVLREMMREKAESLRLDAQVWINTALGNLDEAFEALMRQAKIHSWWSLIRFDPLFERLRSDPRFSDFCNKVGLPS